MASVTTQKADLRKWENEMNFLDESRFDRFNVDVHYMLFMCSRLIYDELVVFSIDIRLLID